MGLTRETENLRHLYLRQYLTTYAMVQVVQNCVTTVISCYTIIESTSLRTTQDLCLTKQVIYYESGIVGILMQF